MENNVEQKISCEAVGDTRITGTLSERRNRGALAVAAEKIQSDWEEKQSLKTMMVYGPFSPSSGNMNKNVSAVMSRQAKPVSFWKRYMSCFSFKNASVVDMDCHNHEIGCTEKGPKNIGEVATSNTTSTKSTFKKLQRFEELRPAVDDAACMEIQNHKSCLPLCNDSFCEEEMESIRAIFPDILKRISHSDRKQRKIALNLVKDTVEANEEVVEDLMKRATISAFSNPITKIAILIAASAIIEHVLNPKNGEQSTDLILLSFDIFLSIVEFAEVAVNEGSVEDNFLSDTFVIFSRLTQTVIIRLGENNKHIVKSSAKCIIFLARQRLLNGHCIVRNAISTQIPHVHENDHCVATLSLRARLNLCEKSLISEIGFHDSKKGGKHGGFDSNIFIKHLLFPAFTRTDEKSFEIATKISSRCYGLIGKSFYHQLKECKVPRPALEAVKARVKFDRREKSPIRRMQGSIEENLAEINHGELRGDLCQDQTKSTNTNEEVEMNKNASDFNHDNVDALNRNKIKRKSSKKKKTNAVNEENGPVLGLNRSKSNMSLVTHIEITSPGVVQGIENIPSLNALTLKPLKVLQALDKNPLGQPTLRGGVDLLGKKKTTLPTLSGAKNFSPFPLA